MHFLSALLPYSLDSRVFLELLTAFKRSESMRLRRAVSVTCGCAAEGEEKRQQRLPRATLRRLELGVSSKRIFPRGQQFF